MKMNLMMRIFLSSLFLVASSGHLVAGEDSGQSLTPVPLELAKFVALDHAKQFYGDMGDLAFYDSEIYYDLKDNSAVYAIVLISSEITPPSHEQLNAKIISRYSEIESLRQEITMIRNQPISGKDKFEKIQNIRAQILEAIRDLTGTETFMTVICGANESYVPVLKLFKGLPKHLTQAPILRSKPEVANSVAGHTVIRTFFLGMFDLAFEFGVPTNSRRFITDDSIEERANQEITLVHSRTGKIVKLGELRASIEQYKKSKVEAVAERAHQTKPITTKSLQQKWYRLKKRYTQYIREKGKP